VKLSVEVTAAEKQKLTEEARRLNVSEEELAAAAVQPPHVHVERDDSCAKFWLNPVRLQASGGFGRAEINKLG
jgi:hypothetical protein